jgi:hypothetical protein
MRISLRLGHVPCCGPCSRTAGTRALVRHARARALKRVFACWGSLWSPRAIFRLRRQIAEDLEEAFGPPRHPLEDDEASVLPASLIGVSAEGIRPKQVLEATYGLTESGGLARPPNTAQRITSLYPICDDTGERQWTCEHCGTHHSAGLGCIDCLSFVCRDCIRAERHVHMADGWTLDEVGSYFGVSRERARQIEAKALRMLRHPSRAVLLDFDDEARAYEHLSHRLTARKMMAPPPSHQDMRLRIQPMTDRARRLARKVLAAEPVKISKTPPRAARNPRYSPGTQTYVVAYGDRLSSIAKRHGVPIAWIVNGNPHKERVTLESGAIVFANLRVGEPLFIPASALQAMEAAVLIPRGLAGPWDPFRALGGELLSKMQSRR